MAYEHGKVYSTEEQVPPVVTELEAIFKELPDEELLAKLAPKRRFGRPGYSPEILWHCFIAYYYLGIPSVSDLIRLLYDNPYIASACGIDSPAGIPSQPTFSRFFTKLSWPMYKAAVNQVMYRLTRRLYAIYPDFGKSVAIDASDIKAWSNGAHRKPTDKQAGWIIKADTNGRGKFTWGFKLSLMVDTETELPLAVKVTSGNVHDLKAAPSLLHQARKINSKFHPRFVICDSGYSSEPFRRLIRRQYRAQPIIKVNRAHKRATIAYPETPEWQLIYNRRTSVERVLGRLKGHRKLNSIRVRGIQKVTVHCLLSVIVMQAQAIATGSMALMRKVA